MARIRLAVTHMLIGNTGPAVAELERSLVQPFGITRAQLRLDCCRMLLRGDTRFQKLAAEPESKAAP